MSCHRFHKNGCSKCLNCKAASREDPVRCIICGWCSDCISRDAKRPVKSSRLLPETDLLLPKDILLLVFQHCTLIQVMQLSACCRKLRRLATAFLAQQTGCPFSDPVRICAYASVAINGSIFFENTTQNPLLEHVFVSSFNSKNGVYMGNIQIIAVQDDTFIGYFRAIDCPKETLILAGHVARMFRDGKAALTSSFLSLASQIIPVGAWFIEQRRAVFVRQMESREDWYRRWKSMRREQIPHVGTMDMPLFQIPSNLERSYFCSDLHLFLEPTTQSLDEDTLEAYRQRFSASETYCPTILLMAPTYRQYGAMENEGVVSRYTVAAVVLDGHHKLQVASELGRKVHFILFDSRFKANNGHERNDELFCESSAFYWADRRTGHGPT